MAIDRLTVLAGRFQVAETVGIGGMGIVARARDLHDGRDIAIKILHQLNPSAHEQERFMREARVLATLRHPGIVSYVAHGRTPEGQHFLAMEWLTGEDLQQRLRRQQLTVSESLALLRGITRALREVHDRGLIHRDLKPSNLFLRDGDVEKVTLIDFGIARQAVHFNDQPLTQAGLVVGTPEFMAPEQARGQQDIGPSADIFSLGCILFTCLTGAPPFAGECIAATLAKILFEEPPTLKSVRPELPDSLATVVSRMLAKVPADRVANARVLSELLEELGEIGEFGTPAERGQVTSVPTTRAELELVSVIVAAEWGANTATIASDADAHETWEARHRSLRSEFSIFNARSEWLADGSLVVTLRQASTTAATDQAVQAARCALLIQEQWPKATIVITTGLGAANNHLPLGEAIDRATRLLRDGRSLGGDGGPWLDEVTSNLLGPSFKIAAMQNGMQRLIREQMDADETRRLVGRPTLCVGREFELGQLEALLARSIDEPVPCALMITAAPGVGKSRVRHEFLRRVRARWGEDGIEILVGRGDPMSAGASYGLLSQALRRLCGVLDGELPADRREKLQRRVMRHVAPKDEVHTVSFLGELCSIPSPLEYNPQLRAARHDPKVMSDHISSALVSFLRAECGHKPVLLVLEDLHWGDALTVKLVGTALHELGESPFMVLVLARPEIHDLFPRMWSAQVHHIALNRLSKRACEQLISEVLGNSTSKQTIERIINQSEGNAFFLEELIRATVDNKGSEVPETVVAMLQVRIGRLGPSARHLLRAASIFGETFWRGGVKLLLGQPVTDGGTDPDLAELMAAEMIQRSTGSRFPGEVEYSFHHALIREAAYGLLTHENRQQGHALAGQYLERAGELDPLVLAEHYQRSGDAERALGFLIRAAIQALEGNDLMAALSRAERAVLIGVQGEQLGTLRSVQAWAYFWSANLVAAFTSAQEAVRLLPAGSLFWCSAMGSLFLSGGLAGKAAEIPAFVEPFVTALPTSEARTQYVQAACSLASVFSLSGNREKAYQFLDRISEIARDYEAQDATMRGWVRHARNWHVRFLEPDPWQAHVTAQEAAAAFTEAGDRRMNATEMVYVGLSQWDLGDPVAAEATLRSTLKLGLQLQEALVVRLVRCYLPQILLEYNDPSFLEEAEAMALAVHQTAANTYYGGLALSVLSQVALRRGELAQAAESARNAVEFLRIARPLQPLAYTALLQVLVRQERGDEASLVADEAAALLDSIGGAGRQELGCRLAIVEAKRAAGSPAVPEVLQIAIAALTRRADTIPDPALRQRFLDQPTDNVRILSLARDYKLVT
ncbi:MAG TPA: protein kinase [Kofleriaceae bacterium]|jgi:serine/threonine protein kinase/tetratricopeptide (TPR) repeat protein|nr:protein kinase [Kofleriaceae bacterium]